MKKRTSKEILSENFVQMMESRPFDSISVSALIEKCGISRATFYRCFRDKYDILDYIFDRELSDSFFFDYAKPMHIRERAVLDELDKKKSFYVHALDVPSFRPHWMSCSYKANLGYIRQHYPNADNIDFTARALAAVFVQINESYIRGELKESPERIGTQFENLLKDLLGE